MNNKEIIVMQKCGYKVTAKVNPVTKRLYDFNFNGSKHEDAVKAESAFKYQTRDCE